MAEYNLYVHYTRRKKKKKKRSLINVLSSGDEKYKHSQGQTCVKNIATHFREMERFLRKMYL